MKSPEQLVALEEVAARIRGRAWMNRRTEEISLATNDPNTAKSAKARAESYETALSDIEFVINN